MVMVVVEITIVAGIKVVVVVKEEGEVAVDPEDGEVVEDKRYVTYRNRKKCVIN